MTKGLLRQIASQRHPGGFDFAEQLQEQRAEAVEGVGGKPRLGRHFGKRVERPKEQRVAVEQKVHHRPEKTGGRPRRARAAASASRCTSSSSQCTGTSKRSLGMPTNGWRLVRKSRAPRPSTQRESSRRSGSSKNDVTSRLPQVLTLAPCDWFASTKLWALESPAAAISP